MNKLTLFFTIFCFMFGIHGQHILKGASLNISEKSIKTEIIGEEEPDTSISKQTNFNKLMTNTKNVLYEQYLSRGFMLIEKGKMLEAKLFFTKNQNYCLSKAGLIKIIILDDELYSPAQLNKSFILVNELVECHQNLTLNEKERFHKFITDSEISSWYDIIDRKYYTFLVREHNITYNDVYIEKFKSSNSKYFNKVYHFADSLEFINSKNVNSLESYKNYLKKYPAADHSPEALYRIEELEYESVVKVNTDEAYSGYLLKYPNGKFVGDAELKLEETLFSKVLKDKTEKSCTNYLNRFPKGKHLKEVNPIFEEIEYSKTENEISENACLNYLNNFPNGKYVKEVKELNAYIIAKGINSKESYKKYLINYPKGKFRNEAVSMIEDLYFVDAINEKSETGYLKFLSLYPKGENSEKIRGLLEDYYFDNAVKKNTIKSYNDYLKKYPDGKFHKNADDSIKSISKKDEIEYNLPINVVKRSKIEAILIVGPQEDGTTSSMEGMDHIAEEIFEKNGIIVHKFYDENADWQEIKKVAPNCGFLIYSGHGSTLGVKGAAGGLIVKQAVTTEMLIKELRLKKNAIVLFQSVCRGAGSSASDNDDIGIDEAKRRVSAYAYPFFDIGASAYYANNYGGGCYNFLKKFLSGNSLGQIFIESTESKTIEIEEPFEEDSVKHICIASNPGFGWVIKTTYINDVKKVEHIPALKGYDVAYVGDPKFDILKLIGK